MLLRTRAETRRVLLQLALLFGLVGSIAWRQARDEAKTTQTHVHPLATPPVADVGGVRLSPRLLEIDVVTTAAQTSVLATVATRVKQSLHHTKPTPVTITSPSSTAVESLRVTRASDTNAVAMDSTPPTPSQAELERVACVHQHLRNAFGWRERGPLFYLRGCNREAMVDFEGWSRKTGCPRLEVDEILVHVGWTGPWLDHFLPDIHALIDSFLATQDTSRARLLFWLMDREPDPDTDPIVRKYAGAASGGKVEFRHANVTQLSQGTCLEGRSEMWSPPGKIQPQTKSDLLRLVLLHKFGGVWVDTDTVLLRDLRTPLEFFGEFGGRFSMNQKYNNAMLSLRKDSALSRAMLELACEHPKAVDSASINAYCSKTGQPCNPNWWYNHNPLQWFTRRGWMVAAPLHFFDPANNCVARGLLSKDGAREVLPPWTLDKVMELVRGAYALHTRSYQATSRPLSNTSTFALIFNRSRELAEQRKKGIVGKTALAPHGLRSAEKGTESLYHALLSMLDSTPYPDPPFFPEGRGRRILLASPGSSTSSEPRMCLVFDTRGGRQPYELPMATDCTEAIRTKDERAVWLWHRLTHSNDASSGNFVGYLRPSFTRTSNVWCLGAKVLKKSVEPRLFECTPDDSRLRWALAPPSDDGTHKSEPSMFFGLKNIGLDACLYLLPESGGSFNRVPLHLDTCAHLRSPMGNTTGGALRSKMTWELRPATFVGDQASVVEEDAD